MQPDAPSKKDAAPANRDRIDAGIGFDRKKLPPIVRSLAGVSLDVEELHFARERSSHRGFERLQRLRRAWVHGVDARFLEEICRIETLEVLDMHRVTATDLTPLARLRGLKRLMLHDATKVEDLRWVAGLPPLEVLGLENLKRVHDLDGLRTLGSLVTLGVEGSMWTQMRVPTLAPLSSLTNLRSLFLTGLRVADRSLTPLHALTNLGLLGCAAYFPDEEFQRLRRALPRLQCSWFDQLDRHGTVRAAIKSSLRGSKGADGDEPPADSDARGRSRP